ncbi:hypothetical protein RC083_10690, partial [Pseudoalteromonas haloplanktis]
SDKGYVYGEKVLESISNESPGFSLFFEEQAVIAIKQWKFRHREKSCIATKKFIFELGEENA